MGLDRTVGTIANPTPDVQALRLFLGPSAEENALHPATDVDVTSDSAHHTVAMSGASSAFIPTTL